MKNTRDYLTQNILGKQWNTNWTVSISSVIVLFSAHSRSVIRERPKSQECEISNVNYETLVL